MAYTLTTAIDLGADQTGLTLYGQLIDGDDGMQNGSDITTGFFEIGDGKYGLYSTAIPDGFTGVLAIFDDATDDCLGVTAINPQVHENADVKVSTRATGFAKNTALAAFEFVLFDSAGDPVTGATVTAQRSIGGAAFGACANAVSEVGSGVYKIDLAAGDLNGDTIMLKFSASGAQTAYILVKTES